MIWNEMVGVGRIVRPHGNRGEVVVVPDTDFAEERFQPGATLETSRGDTLQSLTVTAAREHDGRWIVGFADVRTIDEAESLRGLELRIPADELHAPAPGRYYVHDLVGCQVETMTGEPIGPVREVQLMAGTPLLAVTAADGEVLVPLAEAICRHVDLTAKRIVIEPIEGLLELNRVKRAEARSAKADPGRAEARSAKAEG
jgi:16S rRNA processing protein RimM